MIVSQPSSIMENLLLHDLVLRFLSCGFKGEEIFLVWLSQVSR
jgi:hypothetical protein